MEPQALHHLTIRPKDIEATKEFYEKDQEDILFFSVVL